MTDPILNHAYAAVIETRIAELVKYRNWYIVTRWARGPEWDAWRHDDRTELRALLRLRRQARKLARETLERQDAMSAAKAYAELGYHAAQAVGPA